MSSIPGAGCGVCAKQHIPVGTWIGPYEGKHVKCDDVKPNTDTSYMWEVIYVFIGLKIKGGTPNNNNTPFITNLKLNLHEFSSKF